MRTVCKYSLRKCTDIEINKPFYEVLDEEGNVLFDISEDDNGQSRILFYEDCINITLSLKNLVDIINEASTLLAKD